ncbi:UNVERIFIED_CONTAM: hypothetical protein Scaly_1622000 [Sesamum calycinum]|uniref:Reverse transcriptase domain-containing protein n=1 Tax=Sesamum calycinum TaxID=2727403 RepID=A0AAW2P9Z2_9LAMI
MYKALPLAVALRGCSPFATHILVEAIQPGIKIPNITKYDRTKDPQDHLDRFLEKADLLDILAMRIAKIFRMTLAEKVITWFNQPLNGTTDNFEQLSQHFLHHFAINKRYPKTVLYLLAVIQREHESAKLRRDSARVSKAVLKTARNITHDPFGPEVMMNEESQGKQEIVFGSHDLEKDIATSNDAVVISATIADFWVKKVLVDNGSSKDVIFYKAFSKMEINNFELTQVNTPLTSFNSSIVELLKFPTPDGIGEEVGDRRQARECCANSLKKESNNQPLSKSGISSKGKAPVISEEVPMEKCNEGEPLVNKKMKFDEEHIELMEKEKSEILQARELRRIKDAWARHTTHKSTKEVSRLGIWYGEDRMSKKTSGSWTQSGKAHTKSPKAIRNATYRLKRFDGKEVPDHGTLRI